MAKEAQALEDTDPNNVDMDALIDNDAGEDKTFMAMGVAKTIGTVSLWCS